MKVLITTPLYNGWVHYLYMVGLTTTVMKYGSEVDADFRQGSFLPKLRDIGLARFLESKAEFMLSVDSDIGWNVAHLDKLISLDRPFVSGIYAKKQTARGKPDDVIASFTGKESEGLREAAFVGAGFMLLKRSTVQRMVDVYPQLSYSAFDCEYETLSGLFSPFGGVRNKKGESIYLGEDYSFCMRWRQIGGEVWVDPSVKLIHVGEAHYHVPPELSL